LSLEVEYNYLFHVAFQELAVYSLKLCGKAGQYEYFSIEVESNYLAHRRLVAFQVVVVTFDTGKLYN
jgi:hypothetical protein